MIFQKQLVKSLEIHSQRIAIECEDKKISYSALSNDANKVTQFLLSKTLEKETIIGIDLKDRASIICAIIGVVNARCVFVLLDRSLPTSRMDQLIQDLNLEYVISDEGMHSALSNTSIKASWQYSALLKAESQSDQIAYPEAEGDDSLYIYFTSGSTGMPKGILGKNSSLLQFLLWEVDAFNIDTDHRFSQFISPYFDAFLRDVFVPLLAGGTICIPPSEEDFFSSEKMIPWIDGAAINTIHCVPSLFRIFNAKSLNGNHFKNLRHVLMSGEKINPSELSNWYEVFQDRIQLANLYGATETTMIRSCYKIKPGDTKKTRMPIGSPIADTQFLIAKKNMQPCSTLVPGDLYIISNYLSKGYLNLPELTSERFIKINEGTPEEMIAYKTGDKARKLASGQIELLGREDRQVKLRGIRVELDEVEVFLMKSGLLQNAVAMLHTEENGDESLIAFLIKKDSSQQTSDLQNDISSYLGNNVPVYMVPSNLVFVEEYPLLSNGKINLKGLLNFLTDEKEIVLPVNETEERILSIWKDILGDRNISTEDSFHKVGGNSLSLMGLIARMNKEFQVRISLSELFKNATIQKQALVIQKANGGQEVTSNIPLAAKADNYVLSSAQKRLYFLYKFDPQSLAYNMPSVFRLEGELDRDQFQNVFEKLIAQHEILRTSFELIDGEPRQRVTDLVNFEVEYHSSTEEQAQSIVDTFIRPFDLDNPVLFRVGLIEVSLNVHLLLVDFHHIISDGVSQELLIKEFMSLYNVESLPAPKLHYKDFAEWQQSATQQEQVKQQSDFWQVQFSEEAEALDLPTDFDRPVVKSHAGGIINLELNKAQTSEIETLADQEGASMFMVMLSAYYILLAKISNQNDIVVGTTVAGRHQPELENMSGMFVNTLCLRNRPAGDLSYKSFLSSLKSNTLSCLENQDYPYEELIEALQIERDTSRNPLFDVMFSYQNYKQTTLEIPGLVLNQEPGERAMSKFDMTLFVFERDGQLELNFEYATALFEEGTVNRFIGYFSKIISAITDNADTKIADIDILGLDEKTRLLDTFNNPYQLPVLGESINSLFDKAVSENGSNTALVYDNVNASYQELDQRSNQLARQIKRLVRAQGDYVGILMERSPELIVSIMAVLKSGCAYVPIDPEYPISRIEHIVKDSELSFMLTSSTCQKTCDQLLGDVVSLDVTSEKAYLNSEVSLNYQPQVSSIAYVIYTSGSTGRPKGVKVSHAALLNYINFASKQYVQDQKASFALYSSIAFDLTVTSIFTPLITGNEIIIYKEQKENASLISEILVDNQANIIKLTPTHLKVIRDSGVELPEGINLKRLIVGGEELTWNLAKEVHDKLGGRVEIYNEYGPTEATVGCMIHQFDPHKVQSVVPIGMPIDSTQVYLLDAFLKPVPAGVKGELYIAGSGLAEGYVNAEELTADKFIPNPFSPDQKMYRTGDLASVNHHNQLVFKGRVDEQVKIRGFRIELGEIENQLTAHEQITEAVVTVKQKGEDKLLVAYYASDDSLEHSALRRYLIEKLPPYMVPSFFVHLESLPLTPNGKLDKKALPDPEIGAGRNHVAASSDTEEQLVALWAEALDADKDVISVESSFFELGGHSVLAIKLTGMIQKAFGVTLSLPAFFKEPTIKAISEKINLGSVEEEETLPELSIDPDHRFDPFPLTSVQQAYLFGRTDIFEYGNVGTHAYSESFVNELDIDQFNKILQRLIQRHEMLRMVVTADGQQRILENVPLFEARVLDLNEFSKEKGEELFYKQRNELSHQIFSGEEWPLFDIRVTKFRDGTYKVHYSVDALMLDAGSSIILNNEFQQLSRDQNVLLNPVPISFRDYVQSEIALRTSSFFSRSKEYWASRVEDMPFAPDLALASADELEEKPSFERHKSSLNKADWLQLQESAKKLGITPTILLIGCFAEVLNRWSKTSHFSLNLTLFNRVPFHQDIEKVVGDFTSLTLLEIDFRANEAFSSRLQAIQNRLWQDLEHKLFSGVEMLREMSRFHGHPVIVPVVITSTLGLDSVDQGDDIANLASEAEPMKEPHSITQTPQVWIDFQLGEDKDGLWFLWDSIEGLFPEGMVDQMFVAFEHLLKSLVGKEERWNTKSLVSLPTVQEEARTEVNATETPQSDKYLHQLFAEQVVKTPDNVAVITAQKQFSYSQVNTMSLAVGHKLRALGATPNRLVAIVMEKGWEQVVASMGILYSGGAYLPIGAELPENRIMMLLEQGEVDIVVSTSTVANRLTFPDDKQVVLVDESLKEEKDLAPLAPVQQLSDLAYVIFTSGSSGMPKGVMIDHIGAVNTIIDINERFSVGANDRVLAISSMSFDLSVYDVFGLLGVGGALVIPAQDELRSPDRWIEYVQEHSVTIWNTVPALMQMMVDYNRERTELPLRLCMMSGDWIPLNLPTRIKATCQDIKVISLGGATEASIWSIFYPIADVQNNWKSIPYGKPLKNQGFHVLKPDLTHCPDYVPGDLYISGIGLAKGYWKDEQKTASSFIIHPKTGERLYKTGDLGRYTSDGNIEFLGREDNQVKIQGFRIELGEIEYQMIDHPEVKETVVLARENKGEKYLVAYYQAESKIDPSDFDVFLAEVLPSYMIPSYYVHLDEFPLTPNGKVSVKLLPEPEITARPDYVAPLNQTHERLIEIWSGLLDIDKEVIGINRSFFELGGHSLKAMQMVNQIREELEVEIPLKEIFERRDIQSISELVQASEKSGYQTIQKSDPNKASYVMSSAQKAMYFLHVFDKSRLDYNMPKVLKIEGALDTEKLGSVFEKLVARHEILRTAFKIIDDKPVQVIVEQPDFKMGRHTASKEEGAAFLTSMIRPFDLEEAPLFRAELIQTDEQVHYLVVDTHHIVMDGISYEILETEFIALFNNEELEDLKIQYKDYAEWQQSAAHFKSIESQKEFWINEFSEELTRLELPVDYTSVDDGNHEGGSAYFDLTLEETDALKVIIEREGASMFMVVLSIYSIFLSKLTNQEDIVIGTPVAGREHTDIHDLVGMFAAGLPLRNRPKGDLTFSEFLKEVIKSTLGSFENQSYQYEVPADDLNIERSSGHNVMYDVFFMFNNIDRTSGLSIPELDFSLEKIGVGGDSRFSIILRAGENNDILEVILEFNELFKEESRERFMKYFRSITRAIISNPDTKIADIEIITPPEKSHILDTINNTQNTLDRETSFIELFRKQVEKTPLNTAVARNGIALNYQDLYSQVVELSSFMIANGVTANTRVALYMPRSIDMLTSILAVFYTGGIYVPIDVEYPLDRAKDILENSEVEVVLYNQGSAEVVNSIKDSITSVKYLLNISLVEEATYEVVKDPVSVDLDDLVYMIYTSGTTGRSKGVMIHQLGMINHLYAKINDLELEEHDTIAQSASPCFDISVWQFLAALMVGGKTCIIDTEKLVDPELLIGELKTEKVTIFESVPSLITAFLNGFPDDQQISLDDLRWMIPTGEALTVALVKKWYSYFPNIKLLNAYGPTEASDDVTHYVVPMPDEADSTVSIGQPVQNTHIYIMDSYLNLCPIGIKGEICVAGLGVGKGYWKDEEKTNQAFVQNPLLSSTDHPDYARLYKTGDVGYYTETGDIVCLGRVDEQVKIRGFRIELGEIENVLLELPEVKEAAVIVKEQENEKHLITYYVADEELETAVLRDYLFEKLPDYMVPSFFAYLKEMPLTNNGKLDKSSLTDLEFGTETEYIAPEGEIEEKLTDIWSEVLGIEPEKISAVDSFFSIGGHSLNSITLTGKIYKQFNVKVSLKEFFAKPTVRLLAGHIETYLWLREKPAEDNVKKKELII